MYWWCQCKERGSMGAKERKRQNLEKSVIGAQRKLVRRVVVSGCVSVCEREVERACECM